MVALSINAFAQKVKTEYWDENGFQLYPMIEYQIDNTTGVKNGYYKAIRPNNGGVWQTGTYYMGKKTGLWTTLKNNNNEVQTTINYSNDKMNGEYKEWCDDGSIHFLCNVTIYNMDKVISSNGYYSDGKKAANIILNGTCYRWFQNGQISAVWTNKDGVQIDSTYKDYLVNGKPAIEIKNGKKYIYYGPDRGKGDGITDVNSPSYGKIEEIDYDSLGNNIRVNYRMDGYLDKICMNGITTTYIDKNPNRLIDHIDSGSVQLQYSYDGKFIEIDRGHTGGNIEQRIKCNYSGKIISITTPNKYGTVDTKEFYDNGNIKTNNTIDQYGNYDIKEYYDNGNIMKATKLNQINSLARDTTEYYEDGNVKKITILNPSIDGNPASYQTKEFSDEQNPIGQIIRQNPTGKSTPETKSLFDKKNEFISLVSEQKDKMANKPKNYIICEPYLEFSSVFKKDITYYKAIVR